MKEGYIAALGTPLDDTGSLVEDSFRRHIKDQINAGSAALLVMGTMGNEAYIKSSEYLKVAETAADTVRGQIPLLVGVMDNAISRVTDRIERLERLNIDGVVATTPFYLKTTQEELSSFFARIASASKFPLYLYDLPVVTQSKIQVETVQDLIRDAQIRGIKSGDLLLCKQLLHHPGGGNDFTVMFSGLDYFDIAYAYGIKRNLDGMFSCTPSINTAMYQALKDGDIDTGRKELDKILRLRNLFISMGVFKGFTAAMNLLGYEGSFSPDYVEPAAPEEQDKVRGCMTEIGLLSG